MCGQSLWPICCVVVAMVVEVLGEVQRCCDHPAFRCCWLILFRRCENFGENCPHCPFGAFSRVFRVVWRCTTPQWKCQKSDVGRGVSQKTVKHAAGLGEDSLRVVRWRVTTEQETRADSEFAVVHGEQHGGGETKDAEAWPGRLPII